jgi:GT2 family glycosyltransferase
VTAIPTIDVVTLTWNDGPLLQACLDATLASSGVDLRVFVVDNGSEPPAQVGPDTRVVLLRNATNEGVAARNRGVASGRAPYVAFVDSDARVEETTLASLVRPLLEDPQVGLAAPVFRGQRPEETAGRAPGVVRKLVRLAGLTDLYASSPGTGKGPWWDVDFSISACWVVRRAAFEQVGGLDATYFYGPEDVDFCLRLRHAGWRVVQVADARCLHPPRRRFRNPLTRRGLQHALAFARHLWRHRRRRFTTSLLP